jgi:ribosome-binding protein aMBF1 (putative translation factor)
MKCTLCGKEIEITFLGKLKGNYVKTNGKVYTVCASCFRSNKDEIRTKVNK